MEFYSHKNKKLIEHLNEVYELSKDEIYPEYTDAYKIISYCHDFGKHTTYFQEHLFKGSKSPYANHGFISALFGAYISFDLGGEQEFLPLIIYSVILHHHGSIENIAHNLPRSLKGYNDKSDDSNLVEKVDIAKIQLEDMRKNKSYIEKDYESIGFEGYVDKFINCDIEAILNKLRKIHFAFERTNTDEKAYMIHQILYSALISADKLSASDTKLPEIKFADFDILNRARIEKFKEKDSPINLLRTEIFNKVQKSLIKNYDKSRFFSITAPTGTGKTFTGYFAALKLNELLGGKRRIIYSLPFTSIIDQNFSSIYSLYNNMDDFSKGDSSYLIKHHNLANVDYNDEENDYSKCQAEILIENWNSGAVVTTFVQLFETLVGNRNRMLKKLLSFKGGIILLDEVQAIPIEYYGLVDYMLKSAAEFLDLRIITMTATKPILLAESVELLEDSKEYFKKFNRTRIIKDFRKVKVSEFTDEFLDEFEEKSYLIICNTIKQSLEVYNDLKNCGRKIYYLSTNLIPIHRRERIAEIKNALDNREKIIVVSTQVVEAGVDFDFDEVIRDIGPLDSIIQAAGRCNRNNSGEIKDVRVITMVDDGGKYYGNYVYGNTIINITMDILSKHENIEEKMFYEIIMEYFKKVRSNKNMDISDKYLNSIKKLHFYDKDDEFSIGNFSLITGHPGYIDVYMQIDDEAEEVYNDFLDALSEKDFIRKREKYLQIKNRIKDYTISIPINFKDILNINDYGMPNITREACEDYYSFETGFKRKDDEDYFII
ncbi:MAG TPA: CRISPR-associated helicase/endonuclease Cas3 [Clostridiaceae bacterium]|jgi:CRISPR-associated endonuclease/helicase Cas3|nr:CRISPR-associated helicase/endonuclease Cas3 [Clostridiaceae bacterium]HBF78053.1 CRISPR-associated helicase/endonuclease Cas3 [Clostridiaceae bacterium]HBG39707.1 CRISPR-associated helicase/endonuclease Cas3 [Clostridiaceae bacterium]